MSSYSPNSWQRRTGRFAALYLIAPLAALPWWLAYAIMIVFGYEHRVFALVALVGGIASAVATWQYCERKLFAPSLPHSQGDVTYFTISSTLSTEGALETLLRNARVTDISMPRANETLQALREMRELDQVVLITGASPSSFQFQHTEASAIPTTREYQDLVALVC